MLNTIDTVLRECTDNMNVPFGGKIILMGGDFRQVLPIPNKMFVDGFSCCLKKSPYFQEASPLKFERFELRENLRAVGESDQFKEFLLQVGEDRLPKNEDGKIEIPANLKSTGNLKK